MKKLLTKKVWIAVILLASLSSAGFIFINNYEIRPRQTTSSLQKSSAESKATIRGADVKASENAMQACYEQLLSRDPEMGDGQVLYHMTLNQSGRVDFLKMIQSDYTEDEFHDCLSETIKAQRLPATADRLGVVIAHKYKFKRKDKSQLDF